MPPRRPSFQGAANAVLAAQLGFSKSFRKTTNPDKRALSLRKLFRALVHAVIAILRLKPRLTASEIAQIKALYDASCGVSSVTQLVLLMQHAGVHGTDDVCRHALQDIGYHDGHLMTCEQFRHAFEHCKRDLLAQSKRNDDTKDAFMAIGGGDAAIDVDTMATAIEEFGLTVDVQSFALTSSAPVAQVSSPVSTATGGKAPPPPPHRKTVTYNAFSGFFSSDASNADAATHQNTRHRHAASRAADGDGWWAKSEDTDESWLDTSSPVWAPVAATATTVRGVSPLDEAAMLAASKRSDIGGALDTVLTFSVDLNRAATPLKTPSYAPADGRGRATTGFQSYGDNLVASGTTPPDTTPLLAATTNSTYSTLSAATSSRQHTSRHEADTSGAADARWEGAPFGQSRTDAAEATVGSSSTNTSADALPTYGTPVDSAALGVRTQPAGDDGQSPTRSEPTRGAMPAGGQHQRPLSAMSHRSTPASWAGFLQRSNLDVAKRKLRGVHAPARKGFDVPIVAVGACLNPPPVRSFWREAKIEKDVVSAMAPTDGSSSHTDGSCAPLGGGAVRRTKPPFVLRPTSAMAATPARVVRELRQRPASAASRHSLAVHVSLLQQADPMLHAESSSQLMSRWVRGGELACGSKKPAVL